ncbi:MAG: hypothetical protein QX189_03230 [Methylococcales bacterium]
MIMWSSVVGLDCHCQALTLPAFVVSPLAGSSHLSRLAVITNGQSLTTE